MSGEEWRVHVANEGGAVRVLESAPGILRTTGGASAQKLRASLRSWLMRVARVRLAPRVAVLAQAMDVKYSQISVRRQRSRWGSCSARGTISLNCCLLFQRPEVVDYLIVHELTHVKHMNHSARFWQAVERHCPDWRALDRELVQGWRHVPSWVFSNE
jgi:predicted metal-dependent hydrolase